MEKIDGVTDIATDIAARSASFKLTDPSVDYESKLKEYAAENEHLADFEIVQ